MYIYIEICAQKGDRHSSQYPSVMYEICPLPALQTCSDVCLWGSVNLS